MDRTVGAGQALARMAGALSIVRFRTVVRDTRDTAFVIAAVTVGMAAGAGYFLAPLLALPVIVVGAFAFAPRGAGWARRVDAGPFWDALDAARPTNPVTPPILARRRA
jgi:hypothetical protein